MILAGLIATPSGGPGVGRPDAEALSWHGAALGMSRADWEALAPPGGSPAGVRITCAGADDRRAGRPGPAKTDRGETVCAYVRQAGRLSLPVEARLATGERATHLRYTFREGRLVRIEYHLPVDAFVPAMARFKARFGAPTALRRDQVPSELGPRPRVTAQWRSAEGSVEIQDPSIPLTELNVRLSTGATFAPDGDCLRAGPPPRGPVQGPTGGPRDQVSSDYRRRCSGLS